MRNRNALIPAACAAAAIVAAPASAQVARTWVSGHGDDANACDRPTVPCRSFQGALVKTGPGGEINCVDAAGYGPVTIRQSVTIDCVGTAGAMTISSTNGITVTAPGATVILRNLVISGGLPGAPGIAGIRFSDGAALRAENVTISRFTAVSPGGNGIQITPSSGTPEIFILDSSIHDNGTGTTGSGIEVRPSGAASVKLTLRNVRLDNNAGNGLRIDSTAATGMGVRASIEGSQFSGNSQGIAVVSGPGTAGTSVVVIDRSSVANNGNFGIIANGGAVSVFVGNSMITGNGIGVNPVGASSIASYGDNRMDGNGDRGIFTGTVRPTF